MRASVADIHDESCSVPRKFIDYDILSFSLRYARTRISIRAVAAMRHAGLSPSHMMVRSYYCHMYCLVSCYAVSTHASKSRHAVMSPRAAAIESPRRHVRYQPSLDIIIDRRGRHAVGRCRLFQAACSGACAFEEDREQILRLRHYYYAHLCAIIGALLLT